jgi:two-component system sensor histidine kinase HydH
MTYADSEKTLMAVSLLQDIAQTISKTGPDAALRFLLESAVSISEAHGAFLLTPHEKLREMVPLIEHFPETLSCPADRSFSSAYYQAYLQSEVTMIDEQIQPNPFAHADKEVGAGLLLPIQVAGVSLGLLCLFRKTGSGSFSQDILNFLVILTPFMGTLIENSRLHTEMLHKNSRLSALYDISQKAESLIDLRDAYESLEEVAESFIDFDEFMLYFVTKDRLGLEARQIIAGWPFPEKILLGEGPIGQAAQELKPILTYTEAYKSLLILPTVVSGKLTGVVVIASKKSYAYKDEDIIGLRIIATQIASIDEMFKDLVRLRGFTEHILQSIPVGVLIFDNNGLLTFSNSAMPRILGFPTPEGWSPMQEPGTIPNALREILINVLQSRSAVENLQVVLDQLTQPQTMEVNAYPFRDESGIMLGTAFFIKDVTQIIRLENRLKRADRLSALGVLAAGIAHEIRNPLTGMKMIVQLLMSEFHATDSKREPLTIIQSEIERLERIIANLLDFARPSQPQAVPFQLPHVINVCLLLVQNQFNKLGLKLEKVFPESVPDLIGDPDQLKQVFLNMLTNAVHASKAGGRLTVRIDVRDSGVTASIQDTGIGIPHDRLKGIFDPFYTTKDDGTGLGLSVALRIIEEHGGRIDVESLEGIGSTFSVTLPLVRMTSP